MSKFDKDNFFLKNKSELKPVDMPEFGQVVYVRPLTLGEAVKLNQETSKGKNQTALLLTYTLCDEDGNHLFDEGDYDRLLSLPGVCSQKILDSIGTELLDEKSVEEERKN